MWGPVIPSLGARRHRLAPGATIRRQAPPSAPGATARRQAPPLGARRHRSAQGATRHIPHSAPDVSHTSRSAPLVVNLRSFYTNLRASCSWRLTLHATRTMRHPRSQMLRKWCHATSLHTMYHTAPRLAAPRTARPPQQAARRMPHAAYQRPCAAPRTPRAVCRMSQSTRRAPHATRHTPPDLHTAPQHTTYRTIHSTRRTPHIEFFTLNDTWQCISCVSCRVVYLNTSPLFSA